MEIKNDLKKHLQDCYQLLNDSGENFWKLKIKKMIFLLEKDTNYQHVPDEILSWFGGMGSFNDLILCKENGHSVVNSTISNGNLSKFRETIAQSARAYQKSIHVRKKSQID